MDDAEEDAANSLVRNGLASDSQTSRRIVREVIRVVLDGGDSPTCVTPGDLFSMDELADELGHLVWEIEGISDDHRPYLLDIISKAQAVVRIAKRYVLPGEPITTVPELMKGDDELNSKINDC